MTLFDLDWYYLVFFSFFVVFSSFSYTLILEDMNGQTDKQYLSVVDSIELDKW